MKELPDNELLALLQEVDRQQPDPGELHRLQVLFRHRGPVPAGARDWCASLLRPLVTVAGVVRGPAAQHLVEYEAGPVRIMLELRPHGSEARYDLHGQLFSEQVEPAGALTVLSWSDSEWRSDQLDELGEFHLAAVPAGRCRLTWHLPGARVVLPEIVVGDREPSG